MSDNNKALIPAAAYIRVSSEEQVEGHSLEGQEKAIREWAAQHGYKVVELYQDDSSGSKDTRPGLEAMMMDAAGGKFKAIVVLASSRLFRNIRLARKYKDQLRNKLGVDLIFINQPQMDPNDPNAFMMEVFNEMFDEYYLHQLKFWTSLGKKTRAEKGLWNGTLNFGYVTDEESKLPIFHPKNKDGVILAYETYATGNYSDREVAEVLTREGYRTTGNWGSRPFTKDTVNRMLKNPFYLGYVTYKGELIPGKHPPLISQELFDKCQEVRARRRAKRRSYGQKKNTYLLAGIVRCEACGLTLRCSKTGSKGQYLYYRHTANERGYDCDEPGSYLRADDLEAQWGSLVSSIVLPEDWRKRIEELVGNADERDAIIRERTRVEEKMRRLKQMYQDLVVDEAEYKQSLANLKAQLSTLVVPSSPQLVEAGQFLENLGKIWEAATRTEKRDITVMLVKKVHVNISYKKIVAIEPHPAFKVLFTEVCENLDVEVR